MIPFGEWLPDLPVYQNPGATEAKNVIPDGASYRSFPTPEIQSTALTARCQGAIAGRDNDGNSYNFAGDATKLYKLAAGTWSDVSGAAYTLDETETWQFTQWDEDLIAVSITNNPLKFTMGTSATFANLTTVLKARYCAVVRDFVVVGNTTDSSDGAVPHRVRWCAQGDPSDWTVSAITQGDYNDLDASKGWVRQIVGGAYGTVFQERAISRMTYVGSPLVFQFDQIEANRGTSAPNSVIKFGNNIAYLGEDGWYIFDGTSSTAIGVNKVDKTFYADLQQNYAERVYGVHDPINKVLLWCYPGQASIGGVPNKILGYNYSVGKWGWAEVNTECLVRSLSEGYTLDTMDSYNSSIDAITISLDSRFWTGGTVTLSGFNIDHKMIMFSGDPLDATVETGEFELSPGKRTHLQRVRAIVDGGTTTVQVGSRNSLSDSVTWASARSAEGAGDCAVRNNARYHRVRCNLSGSFLHAQGVDVTGKPSGRR